MKHVVLSLQFWHGCSVFFHQEMPNIALIVGGNGALGRSIISKFKTVSINTICLDFTSNPDATFNIPLTPTSEPKEILSAVGSLIPNQKLNSIINVAGGWVGGNLESPTLFEDVIKMHKQSVESSILAAKLSHSYLQENGLLVLVGASAATDPTPDMLAYGMAKAAVHHLTKSLAHGKSGIPKGTLVTALLPICLDTPMNRKYMPKADFSSWTPLNEISEKLTDWTLKKTSPVQGGLYKLKTTNHTTEWIVVE